MPAASSFNTAFMANDPGFRGRVQAIMVNIAVSIIAEAVGVQDNPTYQTRHSLAWEVLNNADGYLDRFVWATAANLTISGDLFSPVAIASSTAVTPPVVTTAAAHGYATGDAVEITGHLVNIPVNGTYPVTVLSTTTFSVPVVGVGTGTASGQVQKMPPDSDLVTAITSAFNPIAGIGVLT